MCQSRIAWKVGLPNTDIGDFPIRLLVHRLQRTTQLFALFSLTLIVLALGRTSVRATQVHVGGTWTAYAMNAVDGQANVEVVQTDVANHSRYYCPGDPAAYWPLGAYVYLDSGHWVGIDAQDGTPISYTGFYLEDSGDTYCVEANYWVDAYLGRWYQYASPPPGSYYECPSGAPGIAYYGNANSCTDASNWQYYVTYWAQY